VADIALLLILTGSGLSLGSGGRMSGERDRNLSMNPPRR